MKIKDSNKTISGIMLITIIVGLVALFKGTMQVCDYFWHVKIGEYIVSTGNIPREGIFSWYAIENKLPWISQEWLSEVILYINNLIFGINGGVIFTIVTAIIIVSLVIIFNYKAVSKDTTISFLWFLCGIIILCRTANPRPHMLSFILFTLTIYILLDFRKNPVSKKIWFIPLISLLWANIHGGSSNLPYTIAILILLSGLVDFKFGKINATKLSKKQITKLIIIIVVSFLALFINPHGFEIIKYPYINMADGTMLNIVSEWRSPDIKNMADIIIFVMIVMIAIILISTLDEIDFTELLLLGAFVYLTFKSIRFSILLFIVATFIIFKYIKIRHSEKDRINAVIILGLVVVSMSLIFIIGSPKSKIQVSLSNEIIEYVKKEKPKRLFNDYNFGSYLIYNDIPVFVDGRADIYSKYCLEDYVAIYNLKNTDVDKLIDEYKFDMFVIPKDAPLNYYLVAYEKYEKTMEDNDVVIYKKTK